MAALRARAGVLDALRADPPSVGSIFDVLLATSTAAAPFRGRKDDLAWLDRWWADPHQPVVVVTGPAGIGKTRLVTQFASDRRAPWVSGWVSNGCGAAAVAVIRACGDPALILVDDADQRPDLAAFLASLSVGRGAGSPVRIILISRGTGLASRLAATLDDRTRGMLDGVGELPLGPFGGADDWARWFAEAVRAYARARQVPPPDLPAHLSGHVADPAEPILTLHAQALLTVLDSEGSHPLRPRAESRESQPFDRVAAALFAHEQHRWEVSAQRPEFGLTDLTRPVQAQAIAALLLASPVDQAQAVAVLRRVPELAMAPDERRANIARWAAYLYPDDPAWPIQVKPDMLAEWFAVTQLTQNAELAGLLRAMAPAQKVALLLFLAHASDHIPQAVQQFADLVASDTSRLAEAGVAAALTTSAGQWRLDGELAHLIRQTDWSADALGRVEDQMAGRLPRTQAAIAEAKVKIARAGSDAADLARALTGFGDALAKLGRYQEALTVTEEAIGRWRPLARDAAHQDGLAQALSNLAANQGKLGRDQQALTTAEEAIGLWRPLARDNPAHQDGLAQALGNLATRLHDLGRYQEALIVTEEAIGLWRPLARDNPAHQPELAWALNDLGTNLGDLGRYQEALAASEEAIGLWRPLARDDPAHQPGLALTLNNLGYRLRDLGRREEALIILKESVGLWRTFARDNPAYQRGLAQTLSNLAADQGELGRHQEALATLRESVGLLRSLARDNNPVYQRGLAQALSNLGSSQNSLGEPKGALAATQEAIELWRPLARDNPAHQDGLALALSNLGNNLRYLGRYQEALAAAEEAVELWRPLARDNPAHQDGLASALGNLVVRLHDLGRHQEALAASEEAVRLWRALARSNPSQYQETYKRTLALLRRDLDLHGQKSASTWLHLDGDRSNRDQSGQV